MGLLKEYQPQAVIRAENEPLQIYSGEELRQVCRTDKPLPIFFYDIFLSPDGKELIALQAREFSHLFQGFRVYHNFNPLEVTKKNIGGEGCDMYTEIVLWRMPLSYPHKDGIKISIEDDAGKSLAIDIEPYPFSGYSVARIMQQTMQKDYPFVWIRDHVLYMHRLHGIDRYVFYDNGSQNYEDLIEGLQGISRTEGVEIMVINWPFPYTRLWRLEKEQRHYDSCVQQAAFNHGFFMFESLTIYAMNLDIDEYLFNHSFFNLYTCLKLRSCLTPFMQLPGVIIPDCSDENEISIMRANFFPYQEKGYDPLAKYIYKSNTKLIGHLDIHTAYEVRVMGFIREKGEPRKLLRFLNKIGKILFRMTVPFFRREALGYYHFRGINTGWKRLLKADLKKYPEEKESLMSPRSQNITMPESLDPEWMPFDDIKKAFKKIGLD